MSLTDPEDDRPCEASESCPRDSARGSRYCNDHIRAKSGNWPAPAEATLDDLGPVLGDD